MNKAESIAKHGRLRLPDAVEIQVSSEGDLFHLHYKESFLPNLEPPELFHARLATAQDVLCAMFETGYITTGPNWISLDVITTRQSIRDLLGLIAVAAAGAK